MTTDHGRREVAASAEIDADGPLLDFSSRPVAPMPSGGAGTASELRSSAAVDEDETPIARAAASAVSAQATQRDGLPAPYRTRVLVVANQKGGVGKTTSAVNLGAALASCGLRVLVVDLDPQGNASTALGIPNRTETTGIYEALLDGEPLDSVIQRVDGFDALDCVPANLNLAGAEIELVPMEGRESKLQSLLEPLRDENGRRYDYIFVDCPPSLGLLTVNALVAGAEVLIPIQCEYYALEGLSALLENIERVRQYLNPELVVSTILLTMYDGRTRLAAEVVEQVRGHFGETALRTMIPRSVRISEAPSYQQTVMTHDPGSTGAMSYLEAAREIALRDITRTEGESSG